jgi:ABC-type glycerol-3-phosphate transport system permease component
MIVFRKNALRRIFSNRTKRLNRSKSGDAILIILIFSFGIFSALPMVMAINQAFKPLNELFLYPPRIFVTNPTLSNFKQLFSLLSTAYVPFTRYLFNTVFITLVGTVGHVLIASLAAYPLAKLKVPGGTFLFALITVSLMFHATVGDVANYITMSFLGWTNTYLAVIIPALAGSLGLFIMRQFMVTIPDSFLESARIEGANEYKIFFYLIMPNVKPGWITLSIFSIQALWNSTHSTFIYSEELKTLPYALSQIVTGGIIRAGAGAAVGVIMMIVPVTFFVISQNKVIETMATSGMKE